MTTMTLAMMITTLIMIMNPWKTSRLVIRSADIAAIVTIRVAGGHSPMLLLKVDGVWQQESLDETYLQGHYPHQNGR